jgi:hypothetical protein
MCEVQTKENWKADQELRTAVRMRLYQLEAENARLRLGLAAGEMTGDGKKIATMAMAALNAVITAAKEGFEEIDRSPATSQEPAQSLNAAE